MNKKSILLLGLLFIVSLGPVQAFDGDREGFVIGLGVGAGYVDYQGSAESGQAFVPLFSGTLSYGFNDSFQLGLGKKAIMGFKYNGQTVYQELGGIVADFFFQDYYLTLGTGTGGAVNKIQFKDVSLAQTTYIGLGYEISSNLYIEYVLGTATFKTNPSVTAPEKETFMGVLMTTFIF